MIPVNKRIHAALIIVAIVVLSVFYTACGRKKTVKYDKRLVYVDSLCNVNPQKARNYLDKVSVLSFKDVDTVYYHFLCVKTDTKLGKMPASDRLVLNVIKGLGYLDDKRLLGEAYFYAGVTYRRLGNYSEAMECFNAADDLTKNVSDFRLRSYIYSQKGNVLILQGLMDMAITAYRESVRIDSIRKDTSDIILGYRNIAYAYDKINEKQMCSEMIERAIELSQKAGLKNVENNIRIQFAGIYANNKQFKKAADMLGDCQISSNSQDYAPYLYIRANIFKGQAKLDSLFYCSRLMMKYGGLDDKVFACRNLTNVFLTRHMTDSAAKYIGIHDTLLDSLNKVNSLEITAKMNAAYNYKEKENELEANKIANLHNTIVLISVVGGLLLIAVVFVLRLKERNRQQLKLVNELQSKILSQTSEASDNRRHEIYELEKIEHAINSDKSKSNELEMVQTCKNLLLDDEAVVVDEKHKSDEAFARIANSSIYRKFCEFKANGKKVNDNDWEEMEALVDREFPNFKSKLYFLSKIKPHEFHTCLLVKVGFSSSEIAQITLRSRSSISMLRKRLGEKFFGEGCTAAELDNYIRAL